jgi:hypothetical protein
MAYAKFYILSLAMSVPVELNRLYLITYKNMRLASVCYFVNWFYKPYARTLFLNLLTAAIPIFTYLLKLIRKCKGGIQDSEPARSGRSGIIDSWNFDSRDAAALSLFVWLAGYRQIFSA